MKKIKCILGFHNWSASNKEEYSPHIYDNGDTEMTVIYLSKVCRRCGEERVNREVKVSSSRK